MITILIVTSAQLGDVATIWLARLRGASFTTSAQRHVLSMHQNSA